METVERRSAHRDPSPSLRAGTPGAPPWWPLAVGLPAAFGLWELLARTGLISALYFPPPTVIARTLARMAGEGELGRVTGVTLGRMFRGLVFGGIPGLALGWLMGWSRRARAIADPLVAAAHPIPKIALLPLFLLFFGIGDAPRVVAISIGVFFPLVISAMAGVRQISPIHFEVARNLGAGRLKTFARVVVPGSLPVVMAGLRLALNIGLLVTIAVELVIGHTGLGGFLWLSWERFRPEEVYAGLVVLAVIGQGLNGIVYVLNKRLVPWQAEREA